MSRNNIISEAPTHKEDQLSRDKDTEIIRKKGPRAECGSMNENLERSVRTAERTPLNGPHCSYVASSVPKLENLMKKSRKVREIKQDVVKKDLNEVNS